MNKRAKYEATAGVRKKAGDGSTEAKTEVETADRWTTGAEARKLHQTRPIPDRSAPAALQFYPSYAYKVSPTFNKWCKLSIHDIHHVLTDRRGHDGLRHLWLYQNHPIQYIDITAPIVAIEPLGSTIGISAGRSVSKFVLLTLDDGSGAVLGVRITRVLPSTSGSAADTSPQTAAAAAAAAAAEPDDAQQAAAAPSTPSNTNLPTLHIHDNDAAHPLTLTLTLDTHPLRIGTILRAKGTLTTTPWHDRQLDLLRARLVPSTAREAESWRALARFRREVLAVPWRVGRRELARLEREWREEQAEQRGARARWGEWLVRKRAREERAERAYEAVRRREEAEMDAGALV